MAYYSNSPSVLFGGPATPTIKAIITTNVAVFLLQLVERLTGVQFLVPYFGLVPRTITDDFFVWQFVTYMFLHGGPFHLLFNMATLYMFGNELERYWGRQRFLTYYFVTGAGAGFCSWLVAMSSPLPVIGASGAIYGILLAFAILDPNRIVLVSFLLPVKVKYLVLFMGIMAFYSSIAEAEPGVAHIAHLGGMLVGLVILKGKNWLYLLHTYREQRRRQVLKKQFEVYYGEVRRKIENEKGKGPTIH
jgi:membrane associated rhomboid family serine protease